jgi:hypothetical protein
MAGKTRFDEIVSNGIVRPGPDGSIDELLAARHVLDRGFFMPGPGAETALVVETPARAMSLEQRTSAHLAVLKNLSALAR